MSSPSRRYLDNHPRSSWTPGRPIPRPGSEAAEERDPSAPARAWTPGGPEGIRFTDASGSPDSPGSAGSRDPRCAAPPGAIDQRALSWNEEPVRFSGAAGAYFRIWLVNWVLTILTLGIYSAWAKVRRNRYIYGHTRVAGAAFDYHADPVAILKGRSILFFIFILYAFITQVAPQVAPTIILILFLAMPWLVSKARAFQLQNTSWRNIRFDFQAPIEAGLKVWILWGVLVPFTLGFAYPYRTYLLKEYLVVHSRFGRSAFQFDARPGSFYGVYLKAIGLYLGLFVGGLAVVFWILAPWGLNLLAQYPELDTRENFVKVGSVAGPFLVILGYFVLSPLIRGLLFNLVWGHVSLEGHRFRASLNALRLAWIHLSNLFLILLSLGLLIPWAKIRVIRYYCHNLTLLSHGSLDSILAGEIDKVAVMGEELGGFLDVEIGL